MSKKISSLPASALSRCTSLQLLAFVNTAALVLALIVATGFLFLLLNLTRDASALQTQARKSDQATQAMRDEVVALQEQFQSLELAAASTVDAVPPPLTAAAAPPTVATATPPASPVKVRSDRPQRTCEFLPGNGGGLVNCIKRKT